jgi:hypothetical protein
MLDQPSKRDIAQAQDQSPSIAGPAQRDAWMAAIIAARNTMPPLNGDIAIRLALHFNCKTARCDPGYPTLAKGTDCTVNSAKRACRELERDGWIRIRRTAGGHHDEKASFELLLNERVSPPDTRAADLVQQLLDDVGRTMVVQFRDSFEGDDDAAIAILVKTASWPKKARVAYVEQILGRRHAL